LRNANKERTLTPANAVLVGHLIVTLPILAIIAATALIGYLIVWQASASADPASVRDTTTLWFRRAGMPIGALAGCFFGWIWWSASVPRWRDWAKASGADKDKTQKLAARTLLVWEKGSTFEKTECETRKPS
jgi:hypothetical protein